MQLEIRDETMPERLVDISLHLRLEKVHPFILVGNSLCLIPSGELILVIQAIIVDERCDERLGFGTQRQFDLLLELVPMDDATVRTFDTRCLDEDIVRREMVTEHLRAELLLRLPFTYYDDSFHWRTACVCPADMILRFQRSSRV